MEEQLSSKRYEPPLIDLTNRNSGYTFLIELTGYKKNVLEIGTSTGYISKFLKDHENTVTGIEIDPEAGSLAQRYCDRMIISDVETLDFDKNFKPSSFDVILCGDVLEHLKNPALILKKVQKFLKPRGYLVVSLPNFCHGDVFLNLLNGDFRYTPTGLLDETHLRFFGLKNIFSLFAACGYQITDLHTTNLEIGNTELKMDNEKIPHDLLRLLRSLPNSNVYQFIFIASPSTKIKIPHFDETDLNKKFCDSLVDSKSAIQSPLLEEISGKKQQLLEITEKFSTLSKHANNLQKIIVDREKQISELSKHSQNLEAVINERDNRIKNQTQRVHDLEAFVSTSDNQIAGLTQHANNLEMIVTDREKQTAELRQHARNLEMVVADQNHQLQELIKFNQALSDENKSVKQSLTYNLTTKFHIKIVERLFPLNTRRRKFYNLALSGVRILVNEGWDRFWWCFQDRKHRLRSYTDNIPPIPQQEKGIQKSEIHPVIQTKISVIIPTKNAGPDFLSVLEKIKNQKGIASFEIIVVDSGSTDDTREVAEKNGCRIIQIKPEKFNHGLTRNYGAKQASGEYIVFLVQDAIPVGDYWLYDMAKLFRHDKKLAGVTCRQVPRSDADLFAGFILWYHNRSLKRTGNRIYSCDTGFNDLILLDKRIYAGVEDTCCMMQEKIFNKFKFRNIQYGEDLDIGIRFLKEGYKTAFIFSTGVIHSHNRDSFYFFKRSFVDTMALDSLLNISQKPADNNISLKDLLEQILSLYCLIHQTSKTFRITHYSLTQAIDYVKKSLQSTETDPESNQYFSDIMHSKSVDSANTLEARLAECARLVNASSFKRGDSLITSYCALLVSFAEYCSVYPSPEGKETEFYESFDKLFSLIAGSTLATYYCHKSSSQLSESESELMRRLTEGI